MLTPVYDPMLDAPLWVGFALLLLLLAIAHVVILRGLVERIVTAFLCISIAAMCLAIAYNAHLHLARLN